MTATGTNQTSITQYTTTTTTKPPSGTIRLRKCRWAPIHSIYVNGEYRPVRNNTTNQKGIPADLTGKHNADYRAKYVSDPVYLVTGDETETHDTLKNRLETVGVWQPALIPVEIPRVTETRITWIPGFKSLPENRAAFTRLRDTLQDQAIEMNAPLISKDEYIETHIHE